MIKLIRLLIPNFLRIYWNQFQNKRKYDVKFDKGAKAYQTLFEGKNFLGVDTVLFKSEVGYASYFSSNCKLYKAKIGRFCSIGRNVTNSASQHPSSIFVSTHPSFYSNNVQIGVSFSSENLFNEHKYIDLNQKLHIQIGNDVWIGNDVKIMEGIIIGDGAIIANSAVVTKNIEPYTIVGGIPAKLIKKRFTDEQILFLLNLKWWEKDINWIRVNSKYFTNIECLIRKIKLNEQ